MCTEKAIKAARKRRLVIEQKISQYKEFQAQLVTDAVCGGLGLLAHWMYVWPFHSITLTLTLF